MRVMLAELEELAQCARDHERRMADALRASSAWSRPEDRDWIRRAAADAVMTREQAEQSVTHSRALLARVQLLANLGSAGRRCSIAGGA